MNRLRLTVVGIALPAVFLQACHRSDPARVAVKGLLPIPAVSYISGAFDTYPLVAFSEPRHGASGTSEFLASLVRHPAFAGKVNDIVVECGNARYQAIMDRYIAGATVPRDELKLAWENTTIATGMWLAPMYEAVFSDIRSVNTTLPPELRFRVLLGDPPIDWSTVRGPADEDMNDWRDAHFAWVVEEQVIKKNRRALIWIGGAHISRRIKFPDSLIHLLDRRFPGDEVPHFDAQSPIGVELRRRQRLAEATVPFRGGKIRFETDRVSLTSESESALNAVLAELRRDAGLHLAVKAFADSREKDAVPLSVARAD